MDLKSQPSSRGKGGVVGVHVVFNSVDHSFVVGQRATMAGSGGLGVEVRHEHIAARRANPEELSICFDWIRNMAENEAAPNHVEEIRRKGDLADVSNHYVLLSPCSEHLWIKIDSDCILNALDSTSNSTSCIQQPCLRKPTKHLFGQFFVERANGCFYSISRRPGTVCIVDAKIVSQYVRTSHSRQSGAEEHSFCQASKIEIHMSDVLLLSRFHHTFRPPSQSVNAIASWRRSCPPRVSSLSP